MTIDEAAQTYDVELCYYDDCLWHWFLSSGYCQMSSNEGWKEVTVCEDNLIEFLKTWKGFDK